MGRGRRPNIGMGWVLVGIVGRGDQTLGCYSGIIGCLVGGFGLWIEFCVVVFFYYCYYRFLGEVGFCVNLNNINYLVLYLV